MEENQEIKVTKINECIVNLEVPSIDIRHYPIYKTSDLESDGELFARAAEFGKELIRRHNEGEIYAIGYRQWKDGKIHLVLRKTTDGGKTILQRVLGVDEKFQPIDV